MEEAGNLFMIIIIYIYIYECPYFQWIGLRDSLQESPNYYMGKSMVSG